MKLSDLFDRCAAGEVCIVDNITESNMTEVPERVFKRYPDIFGPVITVEEDFDHDGSPFFWVYDQEVRNTKE